MMLCHYCGENPVEAFVPYGKIAVATCHWCYGEMVQQQRVTPPTPNVDSRTGQLLQVVPASSRFRPPTPRS